VPAKSKAQYNYIQAICHGSKPPPKGGPSKKEACEYVKGQSPKGLPAKKRGKS
jgi:hypothetical protein